MIKNYHPKFILLAKQWLNNHDEFPDTLKAVVIAQWSEESGWGKSSAFQELNNAAGLFWREELAQVIGASPIDRLLPSERVVKTFTKFDTLESFCNGYITFINRSHYQGWRGFARDPLGYLKHLQGYRGRGRVAPYCARPGYEERVMKLLPIAEKLISTIRYDYPGFLRETKEKMKIGIDAGHDVSFQDIGASDILNEEREADVVSRELRDIIESAGHEVVWCKPEGRMTLGQSLHRRVSKANREAVDVFVSIHFNAVRRLQRAVGTEVIVSKNASKKSREIANSVQSSLVRTLQLPDRGVKTPVRGGLYVCDRTNMPAILIEVCFVDSTVDVARYNKVGAGKVAQAIAEGLGISSEPVHRAVRGAEPDFNLENAFKYWRGLPHQSLAVKNLDESLKRLPEIREKFIKNWRNGE